MKMNCYQQVLLILVCTHFCRISAVANLSSRTGELSPSSCVGSSDNTTTVCLNQEVIFTCRTSGASFLRWTTSGTNTLLDSNTPIQMETFLANPSLGISFSVVLQSRVGDVFTSTLSATVESNAYDGISITCDDLSGSMATLPLELVSTPPSHPVNPRQVSQSNQCDCFTNRVCGTASAVVMWDCPVNTTGTNVTQFTVTVDVNGTTEYSISPTDLSVTVVGLQVNTNYTATVTASNCNGTSVASTTPIFISADTVDSSTALLPPTNLSSCRMDLSSVEISWGNPQDTLPCPICDTFISWTVNDATGGPECVRLTDSSCLIPNAVQDATYNVTVTFQATDGCEASSYTSFVNDGTLEACLIPLTPGPTTSSLPSSSPTPSPPPVPPTTVGPPLTPIIVGVIVGVLVLLLLIVINIVLFSIWWTRRSDISKCAEIAIIIIHFVTVVGIPFGITILCCKYCECCKETKKASKCFKITITVILVLTLVGIPFAVAIWCWFKKNEKGQKDEDMELKEPSPGSSPAPDSGPPPAVYADPNTIQREEFPGTQDVYTVPDKKKKKHKPEDHLPTYQDPSTISHEVAPTGDMYAQPDKPRKPRGSKKNQQEAPPPTQEQLAEMYSQPDKSKKQQSQGLTYTHIDFHGSGRVPDTQPGVVFSDVKPQ